MAEQTTLGRRAPLADALRLTGTRALAASALPYALAALAACGYAAASLFRHDHFGSNAYDLGIFDQTIWGYSRLEVLPNTVVRLPNLMGDHFHPILMAFGPLYWIWDDPRVLLVAQAALLASAGIPIFLWARRVLDLASALLFECAYLVFWAVLGGNIFDFHELALGAPIVAFGLYGVLTRSYPLVWAMAVLGLLTREDLALTFAAIGAYVVLAQRPRWRQGVALAAVSLAWFAVVFKAILPALAGRAYSHWSYPALGSGPGDALVQLVAHPLESARTFLTPSEKRVALLNLFVPWLGLPLASPLVLVALPTLAARFFSDKPSYWAQGFHYSLVIAPVLALAAVDTTARLRRLLDGRWGLALPAALAACSLLLGLYFSFGRLRPLDELERYTTADHVAGIRACLATIPADASVSATSALVPHLSHRRRIYVLDDRRLPETRVFALDLSTWTFPFTVADAEALVDESLRTGYGVRCSRGSTVVLERGAEGGRLSPELRRLFDRA